MPTRNPAASPIPLAPIRWLSSAIPQAACRLALRVWNALRREAERSDRQVPYC